MNCDDKVYSREDVIKIANIQEREAIIQLCNLVLQMLGHGMTHGMIRQRLFLKIEEAKAKV
jgi:hypothetical protein